MAPPRVENLYQTVSKLSTPLSLNAQGQWMRAKVDTEGSILCGVSSL